MTTSTKSYSITNIEDVSSGILEQEKRIVTDDEFDSSTNSITTSLSANDETTTTSTSLSTKQRINGNDQLNPTLSQYPPLRADAWSEVSAKKFNVRGKTYMKDKIKQPSEESAFKLLAVDLVNTQTPIYSGLCAHPDERVQKALQREKQGVCGTKNNEFVLPEFVFAINLCIPVGGKNSEFYHAVFYFGADKEQMNEIKQGTTPFGRVMNKFIFGNDDEFRNKSLKLIPRVVDGNYIIKRAVGTKPAILGKEMKQLYVKGERYMEVIVDITSNHIANRITKLCLGYINKLSIDLMFVVEGHEESTLPERILGGARISHLDFTTKDGQRTVRS